MINIDVKIGMEGLFKIEAVKPDGSRRLLADWFYNTISNAGLDRVTTSTYLETAFVGSGTTPPDDVTFTETSLTNPVRATSVISDTSGALQHPVTLDWYGYRRKVYRIPPQGVAYNASEVAVGDFIAVGPPMTYQLFSRQLILDGLGSPTTISVLLDESLDITYELRNYPVLTDTAFNVNITGTTPVTHACVIRPSEVDSAVWGNALGVGVYSLGPASSPIYYDSSSVLGPVTGEPTGSAAIGCDTETAAAYSAGSYRRDFTSVAGLTKANASGGIKCIGFRTSLGWFQVSFTPLIAKNSTKVLTLVFRLQWARRVLAPGDL